MLLLLFPAQKTRYVVFLLKQLSSSSSSSFVHIETHNRPSNFWLSNTYVPRGRVYCKYCTSFSLFSSFCFRKSFAPSKAVKKLGGDEKKMCSELFPVECNRPELCILAQVALIFTHFHLLCSAGVTLRKWLPPSPFSRHPDVSSPQWIKNSSFYLCLPCLNSTY